MLMGKTKGIKKLSLFVGPVIAVSRKNVEDEARKN